MQNFRIYHTSNKRRGLQPRHEIRRVVLLYQVATLLPGYPRYWCHLSVKSNEWTQNHNTRASLRAKKCLMTLSPNTGWAVSHNKVQKSRRACRLPRPIRRLLTTLAKNVHLARFLLWLRGSLQIGKMIENKNSRVRCETTLTGKLNLTKKGRYQGRRHDKEPTR